jgi:hypothetical protein
MPLLLPTLLLPLVIRVAFITVFLAVFNWEACKGWEDLIQGCTVAPETF